jgi:hypothetical protein
VDEELRREQMQKFWERYNGLILGAAALIVVGVGGYKFLESRRIADVRRPAANSRRRSVVGRQKDEDAAKAFNEIARNRPGRLCNTRQATSLAPMQTGRTAEACGGGLWSIANAPGPTAC